jgi:Subtilase family
MKINAVKFKDKKSFEKNKTKSNVVSVFEPFGIVVFQDEQPVSVDAAKVSQVNEVDRSLEKIQSGLAICIANDLKTALEFLSLKQVEIKETFEATKTIFVEVPAFASFDEFYEGLMRSKLFISVEPDYIQPFEATAELSIPAQWHLQNFRATEAWSLIPANAYGEVAVLDIACDVDHEDLAGTISDKSWNCAFDTADVRPISEFEKHGTPCSGIICAKTSNDIGVSSIGNNKLKVQFLHIGLNSSSTGGFFTSDTIVTRAVNKAIANPNCLAISMSWGGTNSYTMFANALTTAKNIGRDGKGICVFASSGNQYGNTVNINPAGLPMVYAVGASAQNNTRAVFSNYGPKLFAAAPGVAVPTTDRTGAAGYKPDSNYTNFSGTSAACPVMAGCAAAIILANPSLTEKQVADIIASTAVKSGGYVYDASGKSLELGYGVVDLYAAIVKATSGELPPPPPPSELSNLYGTVASPASTNQGSQVTVSYTVQLDKSRTVDTVTDVALEFVRPDGSKSTFYTGNVTIPKGQLLFTGALPYTVPNNVTGVGKFNLYIDVLGNNAESNESDNMATTSITINAPIPVGNYDLEANVTGYTWLDAGRVRMNIRITNRGAAVVTSYKLKWEFAGRTGTWDRVQTLGVNQSANSGNVMYPTAGTTYPQTFKLSIVSVNGQPDNNPLNDVATCVVNAM